MPVLSDGRLLGEINARHAYFISIAANKLRLLAMTCREFIVYVNRKEVCRTAGYGVVESGRGAAGCDNRIV